MSFAVLTALLGFAFVATVTPGPNNLMLMASGANFGFRRTLPHMLGIAGGVSVMALLVGAGLMALFNALPALGVVLKILPSAICSGWRHGSPWPRRGRTGRPTAAR